MAEQKIEPENDGAESPAGDEARAESNRHIIAGRYPVYPDKPLPEFNSSGTRAFLAADEKSSQGKFFALVAEQNMPYRDDVLSAMRGLPPEYVLRPVDWGGLEWPGSDRPVFGAVFKRPEGGPVVGSLDTRIPPVRDEELLKRYIVPVFGALKAFAAKDIPYRALRPDNLYFADRERRNVLLGENFMAPPGYSQPLMFETVSNGMCNPYGRARGSLDSDLYAFGVTILFLYLGRNPVQGMSDEDLLNFKTEHGSYAALAGRERIPREMKEFLQGLLADEMNERWGIDDINFWIDGRRGSPIQPTSAQKSSWPIRLCGRDYFSCSSLAYGISQHWDESMSIIESGDIHHWVSTSSLDSARVAAIDTALARYKLAANPVGNDILTAEICIALDPDGPLRFRDLAFMPDSLGSVLAFIYGDEKKTSLFKQLMMSDVPLSWIAHYFMPGVDSAVLTKTVDQIRGYLGKKGYGYGIERCLYEFNPSLHCMSPILKRHFVVRAEELLGALDEVAAHFKSGMLPMDKHIAAFVAARFPDDLDKHFNRLSDSNDPIVVALTIIRILAVLQWKIGPRRTPNLAKWLAELMPPLIVQYHNRRTRELLRKRLPKATEHGSLVAMLNVVDDPASRRKDISGFELASKEFFQAQDEIHRINERMQPGNKELTMTGHRAAAICATILSSIAIGFSAYIF